MLREVFDVPYEEIAEALDKSLAAVRQIATRARKHVAARRPRMSVSCTEQEQVVEWFLSALTTATSRDCSRRWLPTWSLWVTAAAWLPRSRSPSVAAARPPR